MKKAVPTGTKETATFIFNTKAGLSALGIPTDSWTTCYSKDNTSKKTGTYYDLDASKTYVSGNATFSTTNNATLYDEYNVDADGNAVKLNTRIWESTHSGTTSYNLRFYTGSSITLGAKDGYALQSIVFELTKSNYQSSDLTTDGGTFTISGTTGSWTAGDGKTAKSATFYIPTTGSNTYINTITVTLVKVDDSQNQDDPNKFTKVTNFKDLNGLPDGTPCVLDLADDDNARVLYNFESQTFLRDNTGAVCFYGFVKSPTMKYNQHVAGYIIGEKNTVGKLPVLKSYGTLTNTTYLAIADQVTEADVTPKEISESDYASNYADWVTLKELRVSSVTSSVASFKDESGNALTSTFGNSFGLADASYYKDVYADALVDVSGIVYPINSDQLVAAVYNVSAKSNEKYKPITYVFDETKSFTSPSADIENARVRLVRTLWNDGWNTLTLPFVFSIDGKVCEYSNVEDKTMNFTTTSSIEAGKPYLVWPDENMENPVFEDVTLTSKAAQKVTKSNSNNKEFSFVGFYSPTELKDDGTNLFLTADNTLAIPTTKTESNPLSQTLRGMRAYFEVPGNTSGAKISFFDNTTGIKTIDSTVRTDAPMRIFTLDGRYMGNDVSLLSKGIYIVGRKKVIIK